MRETLSILILVIFANFYSYGQPQNRNRQGLVGNNIIEFVQDKQNGRFYIDPVDDTINYQRIVDNIYKDKKGRIYILNVCLGPLSKDTTVFLQYYKDVTDFLDLKSYGQIKSGFFHNKGKVFIWWHNSDGDYPIEVTRADPKTFVPFDSVAGGVDKQYVFYGGVPSDFSTIPGADPKTIRVLNPKRGCWNCGDCYFVDSKNVYYGLNKINGADPKTFKLLNQDNIDAEDRHGKYFEGKLIQ